MADMATPEVESVDKQFGEAVARVRQERGLSQRELAKRLAGLDMKVDAPAISRIEAGGRSVRLPEVFKIADALGVHADELLRDVGALPLDELGWFYMGRVKRAGEGLRSAAREFWNAQHGLAVIADEMVKEGIDFDGADEVEHLLGVDVLDEVAQASPGFSYTPEYFALTRNAAENPNMARLVNGPFGKRSADAVRANHGAAADPAK